METKFVSLKNHSDKLLLGLVLGFFVWFFASSLSIAYHKAPQHDDAMFASIPKNFLNGYGWATSYGEKIPFNPDISTGPTLLLPAMIMISAFGNQTWVPAMTGTIMNITLSILIIWQLLQLTKNRAAACLALLLSISLFTVNDFKTFSAYYTGCLLFVFSLLMALNQRYSLSTRLVFYGSLAAIGLYGKPLILLSFLLASPCILFFHNKLGIKKNIRSFFLIFIGFAIIFLPWQIFKQSTLAQYSESYKSAHQKYDAQFFEFHGTGIGQLKASKNKFNYFQLNAKKNYRILSNFLRNENNFPIYILFTIIVAAFFIIKVNIKNISPDILQANQTVSFETVFLAILAFVILGNLCWYVLISFAMTPGHAFFLVFFSFLLLFLLIASHSRSDAVGVILCLLSVPFFQIRIPPLIEAYRFNVSDIIHNQEIKNTLNYLQTHHHRYPLASCGYFAAPFRLEYLLPQSQNFVDCYNVLEDSLSLDKNGAKYYWRDAPNFTFAIEALSFMGAARSQNYVLDPIAKVCLKHILFAEGIYIVCEVSFDEIKDKLDPTETAKQLTDYQRWYRTRIKA